MVRAAAEVMRGRPREFDEAKFLDKAITLFSAAGFSAVSISDLKEATGLTGGSIYKAYQDKEGVFTKALERYITLREADITHRLRTIPTAREKVEALLELYVDLSRGRDGKLGCMVVAGITDLGQLDGASAVLRTQLSNRLIMLTLLIRQGKQDGSITSGGEPQTIAEILLSLLQGMRVVGKGGKLTEDPHAFVSNALKLLD